MGRNAVSRAKSTEVEVSISFIKYYRKPCAKKPKKNFYCTDIAPPPYALYGTN